MAPSSTVTDHLGGHQPGIAGTGIGPVGHLGQVHLLDGDGLHRPLIVQGRPQEEEQGHQDHRQQDHHRDEQGFVSLGHGQHPPCRCNVTGLYETIFPPVCQAGGRITSPRAAHTKAKREVVFCKYAT